MHQDRSEATNVVFKARKNHILKELARPQDEYTDLSPKGEVDLEIQDLVQVINSHEGVVTTSSCAGRLSVFAEGSRATGPTRTNEDVDTLPVETTPGRWLFTSHSPVDPTEDPFTSLFGLHAGSEALKQPTDRLIHFKFEPFILHVLTDSIRSAQKVISAAQQAGFRESGATSLSSSQDSATPMVAVRSHGLAFSSIIGKVVLSDQHESCEAIVSEEYLKLLVEVANQRFVANGQRRDKFQTLLASQFAAKKCQSWEDKELRRQRKREEGLKKRDEMRAFAHTP